jgi:hypothetical protein
MFSVLRENPDMLLRLEGNADEPGGDARNLTYGSRRAAGVKRFFVERGISGDRIEIISYGNERPVCTERTASCQQQNRRVDVAVTTAIRAGVTLDTFDWPPPNPTKFERIPARLCNDSQDPTLGGSEAKIRAAYTRAGYPDNMRTYMIGTDGIAVVGAMEAISTDARYLPGNRRFIPLTARRTEKFEILEFLRELVSSNTGHYRIIVIAVTPRATQGAFPPADPNRVRSLPERGNIGGLPPEEAAVPVTMATPCYGIVYEFERPADPARTRVVGSNAGAKTHLAYAGLWSPSELNQ